MHHIALKEKKTSSNSSPKLLALAQAFEDTGVRAYKGQAGALMGNDNLLTAALQIHSVEARHASEIRRLRGLQGWITLDQRGPNMPSATQAVYDGEIHVTDAIRKLIADGEKFIGHSFKGKYLDCGTMSGYIKSSQEISKL